MYAIYDIFQMGAGMVRTAGLEPAKPMAGRF